MPASTISSEKTRVLLVDDSDIMLVCATAALTPGCTVVGAVKDGRHALEAANTLRPDVIVLDISMPGMTGLEVASRLRANASTAAIVFLTVHDDEDFVLAAKKAGGLGYVIKLRLAADLLHAVEEARAGRSFVSTFPRTAAVPGAPQRRADPTERRLRESRLIWRARPGTAR